LLGRGCYRLGQLHLSPCHGSLFFLQHEYFHRRFFVGAPPNDGPGNDAAQQYWENRFWRSLRVWRVRGLLGSGGSRVAKHFPKIAGGPVLKLAGASAGSVGPDELVGQIGPLGNVGRSAQDEPGLYGVLDDTVPGHAAYRIRRGAASRRHAPVLGPSRGGEEADGDKTPED